ncbi:nitrite reductase small subunit NirD [Nocardiopsis salina]|uniref:nitrite reductase small subunit NirD n=1 Tax=Nocardiopsis salina TaxID=245836 RepID=UPI00034B1F45|nr:nitrite reductase small subunit NirD [Nocardiopsis salina]
MTTTAPATTTHTWITACPTHHLHPEDPLAVLMPDHTQLVLVRTHTGHLHALDNIDPYTGAAVLARGIIGDHHGRPTLTSPLLKHTFDLNTGHSLTDPHTRLNTHPVRTRNHHIQIHTRPEQDTHTP